MKNLYSAHLIMILFAIIALIPEVVAVNPSHLEKLQNSKACSKCDLSDADLQGADLENAVLTGAKLERSRLDDAKLAGANLLGAKLQDAVLTNSNLEFTPIKS